MHLTNYHFYNNKNNLYSKPVKGLKGYVVGYGFAFNGKERDNETYGEGNAYDFGARIYDPRLGKWLSVDPAFKEYVTFSTYAYCASNPIANIELDGARFEFASAVEQKLFNSIYKSADKETKAKLERLANSDIVYYIVCLNEKAMGERTGHTYYNAVASKIHGEPYVNVTILETGKSLVEALGDELETAFQFQNGDIGFTAKLTEDPYKHNIRTLGYDLDDEAATKDAALKAYESCTENCGEMTNSLKAFKEAKATNTVQQYFETDPSAKQYLDIVDPRAKTLDVKIPGNGGYSKEKLQKAVDGGAFDGVFYMQDDNLQSVVRVAQ